MDTVKEERQARRAKDRAQHYINNPNHHHHLYPLLQNIPPACKGDRSGIFQEIPQLIIVYKIYYNSPPGDSSEN